MPKEKTMSKTQEFEYESVQSRESIQTFLQSLVDGFARQCISLKSEREEIILSPQELLNFTIKAKRKGLKNKLSLKISWKDIEPGKAPGPISIDCE
jgi:amphi-Trp domain-containing protein